MRFDGHYPLAAQASRCPRPADICNWCQGPINHPVSKRPCNAFYISTYVESKRVCHRGKPLSRRKKLFWKPFPSLIWTICAIDWGGFYLPRKGYSQNEVRQTPPCPLQKWRIYACKPKSTRWITTNIKRNRWEMFVEWRGKGKIFSSSTLLYFASKHALNTPRCGSFALKEVNSQPHRPVPG